jgi:hypothetical protein
LCPLVDKARDGPHQVAPDRHLCAWAMPVANPNLHAAADHCRDKQRCNERPTNQTLRPLPEKRCREAVLLHEPSSTRGQFAALSRTAHSASTTWQVSL